MRVAEIRIYPVKGLRGLSVEAARLEPWGLAGDRRFMVTTAEGRALTQRQLPGMAAIETGFTPEGIALAAPGKGGIAVAFPAPEGERVEVTLWRDHVAALDAGPDAAAWLSGVLGMPCRLVHMPDPEVARGVDPAYAEPSDRVSFADGFPVLVTNAASLDDLNARLDRPVAMDRFRTNLLVEGAEPWAEDGWRRLRVGDAVLIAPKDCARCIVTAVDQETGEVCEGNEPLRTLAGFRRKAGGRIIFGQNLIPRVLGPVALGDAVEPLC